MDLLKVILHKLHVFSSGSNGLMPHENLQAEHVSAVPEIFNSEGMPESVGVAVRYLGFFPQMLEQTSQRRLPEWVRL